VTGGTAARLSLASAWAPHRVFVETEPDASGSAVEILTVLLRNRRCPWRCLYCDLWKEALNETVPEGAIPAQIDVALRGQPGDQGARHLKLYNAGSFFDRAAIPFADYPAIAQRCRRFQRVIVESHPSLVGESTWRLAELLSPCRLEVAMGLEIADDEVLKKLNKRMTMASFAGAAEKLKQSGVGLRAFVMIKPPFVRTEHDAVEAAVRSAQFAFGCGAAAVSLIPARFGTEALETLSQQGEFGPPTLATIEAAFERSLAAASGRVFVDVWNECPTACSRCAKVRIDRLRRMNLAQRVLPRDSCDCDAGN
jgi:radical SAM enzyme (TIGR01210 family)